jgi:putative ABC transport system permease protein
MIGEYFSLSLKNLKTRGIRSWLTMLGIFIGIAAVVSLITLGQGLQSAVTGQFSDLSPDLLTIQNAETGFGPPGSTAIKKLNQNDVDIIESTPGVKIVIPRLLRVVQVEFNDISTTSYAASIPPDREKKEKIYDGFGIGVFSGKLLDENDRGKVVLGNDFVNEDKFDKEIRVGRKILIQDKEFEVIGILERASTFTLNSVVLMAESDMEEILEIEDEFDLVVAVTEDKDITRSVALRLEDRLRKDRNLKPEEEDFSVQTPEQSLSSINTILSIINLVVVGIASIALLIGGIGISNTMFTSVVERTKEIGVMKSIGARNKDILYLFLVEAGLLGLVGGIVGSIIGLGLAFLVSFGATAAFGGALDIGVDISFPLLIGASTFSFVIGMISGIVPAYQASRLSPVEALRQ